MSHRSTLVGWTPGRMRRRNLFAAAVAVAAVALAWAMFLPWAGFTLGAQQAVCTPHAAAGTVPIRSTTGQVVHVSASGCISSYDDVQNLATHTASLPTGPVGALSAHAGNAAVMAAPPVAAPTGAPIPKAKAGIPAETFWGLAVAVAVIAGLLLRNAFGFVLAIWFAKFSLHAFSIHVTSLTWGGEQQMFGASVHQGAFWALAALAVPAGWLVAKANDEQRKLEGRQHPLVVALNWVATLVFRMTPEKLAEMAATAAGKTAATESTKAPA